MEIIRVIKFPLHVKKPAADNPCIFILILYQFHVLFFRRTFHSDFNMAPEKNGFCSLDTALHRAEKKARKKREA